MSNIRNKVLESLRWLTIAKLLGQILNWSVTIFVIRILTPSDYGLMSLSMALVSFLMLITELGLGAALVQKKELTEATKQQVFGFVLIFNIITFLLLYVSAPFVATFYEETRLVALIRVLASQFLIASFGVVPGSMLVRHIDFKKQSIVELLASVIGSVVQLFFALNGFGVWSLVWGSITLLSTKVIGLNFVSPFLRMPIFSLHNTKQLFTFSSYVVLSRIASFFYSQTDILIAGKILDKNCLGVYSVAMHLASLPMTKVMGILNKVAFPAYSKVQHDQEMLTSFFLKAVRLISMLAFPILWGISSVTPELVEILLGEKWIEVTLPMQLLSLVMPIRMVYNLTPALFYGVGQPKHAFENTVVLAVIMSIAFYFGSKFGTSGLAVAWLLCFPLVALRNIARSLPVVGLSATDIFANIWRPMLAAASMYITVVLMRELIGNHFHLNIKLTMLVASGIIGYITFSSLVNRAGVLELFEIIRINPAIKSTI